MRTTANGHFVLALMLVSAGCGSVAPSPSPSLTASSMASLQPSVPPISTSTPSPTVPPTPPTSGEVTDLACDPGRLPEGFTGHVSAFASLADEIVWSGGPGRNDNDLYRYVPGDSQPELLYLNPERTSSITSIVGGAAGYAFTDERWDGDEPRGWRLWLLAGLGTDPLLIDQSSDDRQIAPTVAMNDAWIAWEVVHGSYENPVNELRVVSVADPLAPTTLLSYPGRDVYMQFPNLWDDELWYGIADNDWEALTERPRVEVIDLSQPAAAPAVFGAGRRAFMPAPGANVVAWKSGGSDELAALNSGVLTLYWRATGDIDELPVPGPETAAARISYPSVGNRFVAWWDDIQQRLYVYDLAERQFRRIAEYDWTSDERVVKQSLAGDLLVYMHYLSDGERYLEWCVLPR
jgi:hypothetical protein